MIERRPSTLRIPVAAATVEHVDRAIGALGEPRRFGVDDAIETVDLLQWRPGRAIVATHRMIGLPIADHPGVKPGDVNAAEAVHQRARWTRITVRGIERLRCTDPGQATVD